MNRIKQLRQEKGYSLKDIAEKVGISESQLSFYENGKRKPRDERVWSKIADILDVSVGYLMGISDRNYEEEQTDNLSDNDRWERHKISNDYDFFYEEIKKSYEILSNVLISPVSNKEANDKLSNAISDFSVSYDFILNAHGPINAKKLSALLLAISRASRVKTNEWMKREEVREDPLKKYLSLKREMNSLIDDLFLLDENFYEGSKRDSHKEFYSDRIDIER